MTRINNKIKKWVDNQLITQEQGDSIISFEQGQNSWQGAMVVFLGIIVLALGCSAIIAANWEITPAWMKLTGNGLLMLAVIVFCWRFYGQGKGLVFEFLALFLLLYVLASIGLIGQIFHTGSPYYVALALWCGMTVGIMLISRRMPVPAIWLTGTMVALVLFMFDKLYDRLAMQLMLHVGFAYAILALLFSLFMGKNSPQSKAAAMLFAICLLVGAMASEFAVFRELIHYVEHDYRQWLVGMVALALLLLVINRQYYVLQKLALGIGGLWCLGYAYNFFLNISLYFNNIFVNDDSYYSYYSDVFIDPCTSFTLLAWLAFYAVVSGYRRLFLLWLVLAGCRICAIFFMASYGLSQTGLALLLSGAVLISIPLLWKGVLKDKLFSSLAAPAAGPPTETPTEPVAEADTTREDGHV